MPDLDLLLHTGDLSYADSSHRAGIVSGVSRNLSCRACPRSSFRGRDVTLNGAESTAYRTQ